MKDLLEKYEEKVGKSNVKLGYHIIRPNTANVTEKISQGYDFIALGLDTLILAEGVKNILNDV